MTTSPPSTALKADYEQNQAKLRDRHGVADEDDLHIDPPRPAEVNPELYRDVDPMLFKGFIHQTAKINDVTFVFKSLNHHEFELLSMMGTSTPSKEELQKFYHMFLAYGVLMIDGQNVLKDRDHFIPQLMEFFSKLEDSGRKKVIYHLSELNRRAKNAVLMSEVYVLEPVSRLRWAQVKGLDLGGSQVTGFPGTEQLGLNWGQFIWRALNHLEDIKEAAEREWENAKFVASAMAGKGMSKIHAQDKRRRNQEQQDRLDRRDRILRLVVLGEQMDSGGNQNLPIRVARTTEELTRQLERDLKGEKDFHDLVVEEHEKRVKQQQEERMSRVQEMQAASAARYGDAPISSHLDMTGKTPQEVQILIERKRQLAAQRLADLQQYPEVQDEKRANFANKWNSIVPPVVKR